MAEAEAARKMVVVEQIETGPISVLNPAIHKEMNALTLSVKSSKEMFQDFLKKRGRDGRNFGKSGRNKSLAYISNASQNYQSLVERQKKFTEEQQIKRALSTIGIHRK